jgi:hypothetical protein
MKGRARHALIRTPTAIFKSLRRKKTIQKQNLALAAFDMLYLIEVCFKP